MRMLRLLLLGSLLVSAGAAPCQAQATPAGPSVVYKGHDGWQSWFIWDDVDPTEIAVFSSDPQFFTSVVCDGAPWPTPGEDWLEGDYTTIVVAQMKLNSTYRGAVFTRIYKPAVFPTSWSNAYACGLLREEQGPLVAQGISEWFNTNLNVCDSGPGRYTWSARVVGHLSAPTCTSGMAKIDMQLRYMLDKDAVFSPACAFDPADIRTLKSQGPELTCIGTP